MTAQQAPVTNYTFSPLRLSVKGLGVYLGGEHLRAACDRLTVDELRAANREAWKQRRAAARQMDRTSNVTMHGWRPYDCASQQHDVAEAVCRETWKRMKGAQ